MSDKKIRLKDNYKKLLIIIALLFAPFLVGHVFYETAIINANALSSDAEKVEFSADFAYNHIYSFQYLFGYPFFRSGNDLLGFYVLGFSGCGELSYIQRCMLDRLGIEARPLVLLDDHEFNEVKVNGTWMVSDPGYADCHFLSTQERGQKRIEELGGLSVAYTIAPNGSIVWRTQDYVPVDWVTIRILNGAVSLSNCSITISCTTSMTATLDEEGCITIPIGNLAGFKDGKTYLTVNVSGKEFKIESLGEGRHVEYVFNLMDSFFNQDSLFP
ncbi:MAG: hypothetical protein QXI12_08905 [Candidatus Methanomethyliaceae archaeon]